MNELFECYYYSLFESTSLYDPYNEYSFVEANKRRRGDVERRNSEKLENRFAAPAVKKIYVKANGDPRSKRPKLFIWRQWQTPTLAGLRAEVAPYVGLESSSAIYDINGHRIYSEDEIQDFGTYYILGDEQLLIPDSEDEYEEEYRESFTRGGRITSLSAPEMLTSRQSLYDTAPSVMTPPPRPYQSEQVSSEIQRKFPAQIPSTSQNKNPDIRGSIAALSDGEMYERYYRDAVSTSKSRSTGTKRNKRQKLRTGTNNNTSRYDDGRSRRDSRRYTDDDDDRYGRRQNDGYVSNAERSRTRNQGTLVSRSRSANGDYLRDEFISEFDTDYTKRRDQEALAKHRQKQSNLTRSSSDAIYNRRDQTHPDAYIIYVFLNGEGMDCQHMHFQKKQLAKGMNYILELVARRFNVNPTKLCDMDGRKITEPSQLMSRGAYVLVAAGQSFRDTWYFLPDNAIDTSSDRNRVEERSDQRDRLLQRREKRERAKLKSQKSQATSQRTRYVQDTVTPGRKFGNSFI
ncbi:unnamed protein product [Cylicocyclus nassatus]|uniref:Doublecortin domain-containing protein n=1 Tax=Cylicocyclus nassatus TaxID=53992 RepID=A0AA36MI78_CYLNA|nr:unnamed protein product [Cylicocyclus nassatus]